MKYQILLSRSYIKNSKIQMTKGLINIKIKISKVQNTSYQYCLQTLFIPSKLFQGLNFSLLSPPFHEQRRTQGTGTVAIAQPRAVATLAPPVHLQHIWSILHFGFCFRNIQPVQTEKVQVQKIILYSLATSLLGPAPQSVLCGNRA